MDNTQITCVKSMMDILMSQLMCVWGEGSPKILNDPQHTAQAHKTETSLPASQGNQTFL